MFVYMGIIFKKKEEEKGGKFSASINTKLHIHVQKFVQ